LAVVHEDLVVGWNLEKNITAIVKGRNFLLALKNSTLILPVLLVTSLKEGSTSQRRNSENWLLQGRNA
jgi:hypothetical protein